MSKKLRFLSFILCIIILVSSVPVASIYAQEDGDIPAVTNPFISDVTFKVNGEDITSKSFRIPSIVTLSDGTVVAAADIRWNTTYDGGGIDTLVARSTDGGVTWNYDAVNYLGDNGNIYNGSKSTAFLDPCLAVGADGKTVYMLVDLYPYGVALNGDGTHTQPVQNVAFNANGNLLLSSNNGLSYGYYLKEGIIYSSNGTAVEGYKVDAFFNITGGDGTNSNLFFADSPFKVVRTGYLYLRTSNDGGITWSNPELLNLKTSSERVCLVAPGSSITTSDGTLIFPVYSYHGDNDPAGNTQRLSFIYSSDGKNWSRSSELDYNWASEAAVTELENGMLRFFIRNGSKKLCYVDYGVQSGWGNVVVMDNVSTNSNTQISAITYSKTSNNKQVILVSCPTGPNRAGSNSSSASQRLNGSIFVFTVNEDGSMLFENTIEVNGGDSMFIYSSLTERADGSVAILYENSENGWGTGDNCYYTMDVGSYSAEDLGIVIDETRKHTDSGVTVEGDGVPFGVTFSAEPISDAEELERINCAIGRALYPDSPKEDQILELNRPSLTYSLDFISNRTGEDVQPEGKVTVTVPVSSLDIADGGKCAVFHLHDDGKTDVIFANVHDGVVSFELDGFSIVKLANGEGAVYNVKSFYDVSSESISGNGQFTAAGVYFTDEGSTHVLIGGAFNPKQSSKIISVTLDNDPISVFKVEAPNNSLTSINFYDGNDVSSTLIFKKNAVDGGNNWLDIDLGTQVDIGEYFTFQVETSTGGGQEGVAFNFGVYVTADIDYTVTKTVHKVGDTVVDSQSAHGVAGEEVIFRLDAINQGDPINGVTLEEAMPDIFDSDTVYYSTSADGPWTKSTTGLNFSIDVGDLAEGQTGTRYVKATVKNMNIPDGTYSNVVSMKSTSEDIVPTAEAGLSFSSSYDVTKSVEKVGGNAPTAAGAVSAAKSALAKAGDEVIYKVTVKNDGDSALSGVKITDNLPIGAYTGTVYCGTNMSSMTEVNVVANSFVIADSATIPANGSVTYYVKTTVPTVILSGTYSNKVQMAVSVGGTTVTLQDSASIVIEEILDYSIEKTVYQVNGNAAGDEVPSVMLGDKVIYKITVKNDGNSDLVDTSINEILPGCASDAKYSPDMISWTEFADVNKTFPAGVFTEGVYSIPAGGTYTYYVMITVDPSTEAGGIYVNTAELIPGTRQSCSDSAEINVILFTALTICKTGHETIDPNQTFMFRVTGEDGTDVTVTVHENGSAVVDGLKVNGNYTVVELTDWSWRYSYNGYVPTGTTVTVTGTLNNGAKIVLGQSGNKITFDNERSFEYWLDGDSWCENIFK